MDYIWIKLQATYTEYGCKILWKEVGKTGEKYDSWGEMNCGLNLCSVNNRLFFLLYGTKLNACKYISDRQYVEPN